MTTIIKNGTVVTADLTYKADVRVENGVITEIGQGLQGGTRSLTRPAAM
jgi:dihydropyrimidinase